MLADTTFPDRIAALTFSSNLMVSIGSGIELVDSKTLKPIPGGKVNVAAGVLAYHTPTRTLVTSASGEIHLWNMHNWLQTRTLRESETEKAHAGDVRGVAFDPQGSLLATAGADRMVKVWNLVNGRLLARFPVGDAINVAFSPDGRHLAATGAKNIFLYAILGLREQTFLAQQSVPVRAMSLGDRGRTLATLAARVAPSATGTHYAELAVTSLPARSTRLLWRSSVQSDFGNYSVSTQPVGPWLAFHPGNGSIHWLDPQAGNNVSSTRQNDSTGVVLSFDRSGRTFACIEGDRAVWRRPRGEGIGPVGQHRERSYHWTWHTKRHCRRQGLVPGRRSGRPRPAISPAGFSKAPQVLVWSGQPRSERGLEPR